MLCILMRRSSVNGALCIIRTITPPAVNMSSIVTVWTVNLNSCQQLHSYHCDTKRDLQITFAVICGYAPCFMICRWTFFMASRINRLQNYGSLTDRVLICALNWSLMFRDNWVVLSSTTPVLLLLSRLAAVLVWLLLWYWWAFFPIADVIIKKE